MNKQTFSVRAPGRPLGSAAFTLIELLVVISIIAVLAGLLLPVTSSVMKTARKTSARNTEMQIVAAVNSYYTEYSQYPIPVSGDATSANTDYTYVPDGSTNHNGELFNVLRALNVQSDNSGSSSPTGSLNSRRISYFEAKNVKSATSPKDGFILQDDSTGNNKVKLKAGDLVDPWGNLYGIRMDGNYSNAVDNPYDQTTVTATDSAPNGAVDKNVIRIGVVSFSYGEDGKPGNNSNVGSAPFSPTPGDDVDSWQ